MSNETSKPAKKPENNKKESNNQEGSDKDSKNKFAAIADVTNPLKFFALALLIVEALIGILSVNASAELLEKILYAAVGMFVLVVMVVVWIAFKIPHVLLATTPSELNAKIEEIRKEVKETKKRRMSERKIIDVHGGDLDKILDIEPTSSPIIIKSKEV
jgi:hypothetical protein